MTERERKGSVASDDAPLAPRHTIGALPAYRYLPGRAPHPRRDPRGHSYGRPEPATHAVSPDAWADDDLYLRAVDLYNCRYFWEAHELFEALWRAFPRESVGAQFFQGIIQVAAANLKRMTAPTGGEELARRGLERLGAAPDRFMGLDVRAFERDARAYMEGSRAEPAAILLAPRR